MLQPRTYPEMLGKALVLEADPFITMTDDDNPWLEGLFFIISLGVLVGLAQFVGGVLLTASLPPHEALREALVIFLRPYLAAAGPLTADATASEELIRQAWQWIAFSGGYGTGWARLTLLIAMPASLVILWLLYGVISHAAARRLGGNASLNQTLGVTALTAAPQILLILTIVPFVSVGWPLLLVWAVLIGFRGLEIAHDLSWQRSVLAALAAPILLIALALGMAILLGMGLLIGGLA